MDIRDLLKVLILICAVIYESAGTKSEETSIVVTDGNHEGAQNDGTVVTPPKDGNYKLSYAGYEMTWRNFKREYNKKYPSTSEEKRRFAIFMDNVKTIEAHNMKFHLGQSTYWMDINHFSDWTQKEFEEWLGPLDMHTRSTREAENNMTYKATKDANVPETKDWSKEGFVTQVKNQAKCGSCYAFSTTGSVEGQWFRKTRKLINLSEQQIVDCSVSFGNNKCNGGNRPNSFRYIISVGGLQNETTYPYEAENGTCKFNKSLVVAQIKSYQKVSQNEEALKSAVGIEGPVSVSIYVNNNFKQFGGGIYNDSTCGGITPNHAVLVVGYGKDYWIVKNCWGSTWGSNVNATGYIKMARNTGGLGMCSIAGNAYYPLVSDPSTSCPDTSKDSLTSCPNRSNKLDNISITVLVTSTLLLLKFTQLCF